MNRLGKGLCLAVCGVLAAASGCRLDTGTNNAPLPTVYGNDLVINEVFNISPTKFYAYSWVEIYNPTQQEFKWVEDYTVPTDTFGNVLPDSMRDTAPDSAFVEDRLVLSMNVQRSFPDTLNADYISKVDEGIAFYTPLGNADNIIFPDEYVVVVNNRDKFDAHTRTGPFNPSIQPFPFVLVIDTIGLGVFRARVAFWNLLDEGEIALYRIRQFVHIRSGTFRQTATLVDAVRYGNYAPVPDPTPENISLGPIPEGSSFARFAADYRTGRSTEEFYVSDVPLPGWRSNIRH